MIEEQSKMDEKGYEMMLVFMLFYLLLLIPTIIGIVFEDKTMKEKLNMLEARVCDLETELYFKTK